jgi:hypothetical protein
MHIACKSRIPDSLTLMDSKLGGLLLTRRLFFSWFIVGQLFASVALYCLKATDPLNYKTPIYTQVSKRTKSASQLRR